MPDEKDLPYKPGMMDTPPAAEVEETDTSRDRMLYPHNVLEGFGNGCLADLRVRIAIDWLRTSPVFHGLAVHTSPEQMGRLPAYLAGLALELADEVLKQGEARGWVEPLPDCENKELGGNIRAQARRTAAYNILQQMEGAKFAQEEQGQVVPAAPRAFGGRVPGH